MTQETIRQLDVIASQLSATLLGLDPDDVDDDFERALHAITETLSSFDRRRQDRMLERAMLLSTADTQELAGSRAAPRGTSSRFDGDALDALERRHIEHVLYRCNWRINGKGNAAERLNLHPNTLRFRMKKLGLTRPAAPRHPAQ
jgi:transcriptional regulator with GAF, ATPase, and Fis domain